MQTRRTFLKFGIMLASLCFIFAVSSDFVKVENTKAYVFSLSDKCVNTFTGDASGETSEPSTEHGEVTTARPSRPETDDKTAGSETTGETTTRNVNTDKISPPTGASQATPYMFIVLLFAAAFTVSIGMKKSKHFNDLSVK